VVGSRRRRVSLLLFSLLLSRDDVGATRHAATPRVWGHDPRISIIIFMLQMDSSLTNYLSEPTELPSVTVFNYIVYFDVLLARYFSFAIVKVDQKLYV